MSQGKSRKKTYLVWRKLAKTQWVLCSPRRQFVTVVLKVGMSCGGCVGAVKRVLGKMEGVETFDIDLEQQKVTVKGNVQPDAVLQTVSKTGKKTEFWPAEGASATA